MAKLFWIYTHNFTHTGAPLVMASIARELAAAGWREQLRVVSWGGLHDRRHSTLQHELALEGIHCQTLDLNQKPPRVRRGDRLFLNSLALPEAVIQQALDWLQDKQISRVDWYCHEGNPQAFLPGDQWKGKICQVLNSRGLHLRVPSMHTLYEYQEWLGYIGPSLNIQIPKVEIPAECLGSACNDYSELRLQLTGAVGSGHKGHLWLLSLIEAALQLAPQHTPGFRPIRLQFIGIEAGPYAALSRRVCFRANNLLGDHFSWNGQATRLKTLKAMSYSNLSVICSISETFSLVCAEAMALGQPILRNRTGGWHEQLIVGETGFDLGRPEVSPSSAHVNLLHLLRQKESIPDAKLSALSRYAVKQSNSFQHINVTEWLR